MAFKDEAVARFLAPESADINVVANNADATTPERWRADGLASGKKRGGSTAAARPDAVPAGARMRDEQGSLWCGAEGIRPSELAEWNQAATDASANPSSPLLAPSASAAIPGYAESTMN